MPFKLILSDVFSGVKNDKYLNINENRKNLPVILNIHIPVVSQVKILKLTFLIHANTIKRKYYQKWTTKNKYCSGITPYSKYIFFIANLNIGLYIQKILEKKSINQIKIKKFKLILHHLAKKKFWKGEKNTFNS